MKILIPNMKRALTFDDETNELIYLKDKKKKKQIKTYTERDVKKMLTAQKKICSIAPLLNLSRGREDWREWNKFMRQLSASIKALPSVNFASFNNKK